jgi:hypothetical protein
VNAAIFLTRQPAAPPNAAGCWLGPNAINCRKAWQSAPRSFSIGHSPEVAHGLHTRSGCNLCHR